MALPFIQGFGGLPVSSTNSLIESHLNARGMRVAVSSTQQIREVDGLKYLWLNSSTVNLVRFETTNELWVGIRFADSTSTAVENVRLAIRSEIATIWCGLTSVGSLRLFRNPTGSGNNINYTVPDGPYPDGVFVEFHFSNANIDIYVNGELTPSGSTTTGTLLNAVAVSAVDLVGGACGYTDIYVSPVRLGEGSARPLPLTAVDSNTGTVVGASTALEALAVNFVDSTKTVVYEDGQRTLFNQTGIVDNPETISAVQVTTFGRKTGTALLREEITVSTASENQVGSPALAVPFAGYNVVLTADPHDNGTWTKSRINSMKIGVGSSS